MCTLRGISTFRGDMDTREKNSGISTFSVIILLFFGIFHKIFRGKKKISLKIDELSQVIVQKRGKSTFRDSFSEFMHLNNIRISVGRSPTI